MLSCSHHPRAHPRRGLEVSVITSVPRYLHAQNRVVGFVTYTQSRPRLSLAARSRHITHPRIWGLCHWAGEPNPGVYQVYNHQPRTRVQGFRKWWKRYTRQTPTKNVFFTWHRASIRNQHPRKHLRHQRNPSAFLMKPRVYKPQKKWAAVGIQMAVGFSSLFLKWNHTKPRFSSVCPLNSRVLFPNTGTKRACSLLYCPVYSRIRKWGPGSRQVRGASRAAPGLGR